VGGNGGNGASGVVIVSCLRSTTSCTGGTVTTNGAYDVVTFTSNGTLVISEVSTATTQVTQWGDF